MPRCRQQAGTFPPRPRILALVCVPAQAQPAQKHPANGARVAAGHRSAGGLTGRSPHNAVAHFYAGCRDQAHVRVPDRQVRATILGWLTAALMAAALSSRSPPAGSPSDPSASCSCSGQPRRIAHITRYEHAASRLEHGRGRHALPTAKSLSVVCRRPPAVNGNCGTSFLLSDQPTRQSATRANSP
jgi:hypothetical protein